MHGSRLLPSAPSPSGSRLPVLSSPSIFPTEPLTETTYRWLGQGINQGRRGPPGNRGSRGSALIGPGWAARQPPRAWRTFLSPAPPTCHRRHNKTELFQARTTRASSSFPSWAGETGREKAAFSPRLLKIPAGSEAPNATTAVVAGRPASDRTPPAKDRIGLLAHRPCRL